jgi:hypothetical protein
LFAAGCVQLLFLRRTANEDEPNDALKGLRRASFAVLGITALLALVGAASVDEGEFYRIGADSRGDLVTSVLLTMSTLIAAAVVGQLVGRGQQSAGLAVSPRPPYYPRRQASALTGSNVRASSLQPSASVAVSRAPLREVPAMGSPVLFNLTLNEEVAVIQKEGTFLLVQTAGGRRGYLSVEAVGRGGEGGYVHQEFV